MRCDALLASADAVVVFTSKRSGGKIESIYGDRVGWPLWRSAPSSCVFFGSRFSTCPDWRAETEGTDVHEIRPTALCSNIQLPGDIVTRLRGFYHRIFFCRSVVLGINHFIACKVLILNQQNVMQSDGRMDKLTDCNSIRF